MRGARWFAHRVPLAPRDTRKLELHPAANSHRHQQFCPRREGDCRGRRPIPLLPPSHSLPTQSPRHRVAVWYDVRDQRG